MTGEAIRVELVAEKRVDGPPRDGGLAIERRIDLAEEPCPAITTHGLLSRNLSQFWLERTRPA